jgi:hypothetical protein
LAIRSLISNKDPQSQLGSDKRAGRPKRLSHGGKRSEATPATRSKALLGGGASLLVRIGAGSGEGIGAC